MISYTFVLMTYLSSNIKYLRHLKGFTQAVLGEKLRIKRSLVGAYEEGRAEPKIATMQNLAVLFQTSIDALVSTDLSAGDSAAMDIAGRALRILPITITPDNQELISVVPIKAEAGYTGSYGDPEYIESLPQFSLPLAEHYPDRTTRLFQISGDSMLPMQPGSYIIASYVEDWFTIRDGQCYIVVTHDQGIVYKRLWNHLDRDRLLMKSDNPLYKPYEMRPMDIAEIWQAEGYISFQLPDYHETNPLEELKDLMTKLQYTINHLHTPTDHDDT